MNETMVLSLLSSAVFTFTAIALFVRKKTKILSGDIFSSLLLSVLLYDFIVISNFLEHSQITDYFDPVEDIAEIVFTFLFLYFINSWKKERSQQRFRIFFKQAPLPMAEITGDGKIKEMNEILVQNISECFGPNSHGGPKTNNWIETLYPDPEDRKRETERWEKMVASAYKTGGVIKPETSEITCADGTKKTLIIGASAIGENILVSMVDITDREKAEEEKQKLQEQLYQSRKLEAVGILAGGIAHDFNNMLGAIIGYAELSIDEMEPENPTRQNLAQILEAANRSSILTRQLLGFARKQEISPEVFEVNESIKGTLKMLRRLIGENIEVKLEPWEGELHVKMDPSQFDQILTNLCVNAKDAIKDIGRIVIETDMVTVDEMYCASRMEECEPGEYAKVIVTDNGTGMDDEVKEHVFEPFYTTKDQGKGTGLGLATVYGIVKQNRGMIYIYSEKGHGTSINILLPMYVLSDTEKKPVKEVKLHKGKGESILIVEDDPIVLEMSMAMLERLGYSVIRAESPGEAIRIAENDAVEIRMVLTDMVMPEMNGRELADQLKIIRPDIRCLFMSGYSADHIDSQEIIQKKVNFIRKPFSMQDLAMKISSVLETS